MSAFDCIINAAHIYINGMHLYFNTIQLKCKMLKRFYYICQNKNDAIIRIQNIYY